MHSNRQPRGEASSTGGLDWVLLTQIVLCIASAWLVLHPMTAIAQGAIDPRIQKKIDEWASKVESWRRDGFACLWLTLGAGTLGVVVGGLQILRNKVLQGVLLFLGIAIGVMTLVNNTLYGADFRTYRRLVTRAERLVGQMRDQATNYTNDAERKLALDTVYRLAAELAGLEDSLLEGTALNQAVPAPAASPSNAALSLDLLSPVLAAELSTGACGKHPTSDALNLYFVGLGSDRSLDVARAEALEGAHQGFADDLRTQLPPSSGLKAEDLARFVSQVATVADTCFERPGKGREEYRVFVTLLMPRSALREGMDLFGAREKVDVGQAVQTAVQRVQPSTIDYRVARQNIYDELARAAQADTKTETYRAYEEGRRLRQARDCAGSLAALGAATKAKPGFYLALYNLALAQDMCGDPRGAAASYRRALEVAPKSPKDASFYNTYGWFLYQQKQYAEAVKLLEQALAIEPTHARAKTNLVAAQQALGSQR
jgi:tetratricopeptide (TPR) repeat protein